ncbi:MAG TPA: O-antigen ligase family protein [Ktedonosporobacter sp.]|nr:O-antigen ligase family protein [Ktedonosporobacter sp.]
MSSQNPLFPLSDVTLPAHETPSKEALAYTPTPPEDTSEQVTTARSFWRDRCFEGGLILSMVLYYIVGNANFHLGALSAVNPLFSLPLLLVFAVLCWYRLPFALALLPLSLPYYLSGSQKVVMGHAAFSLAEITLWTCLVVAVLQLVLKRSERPYWLSWSVWRDRLGPFGLPILVFLIFAAISILVAYRQDTALRAFREEVLDPLLYLGLALIYLRSRQDVLRLLVGLLGTGLVIALLGIGQALFFKNTLVLEQDGIYRVHAVYGSANSIGLLLDYVLPLALAFVMARVSWRSRLIGLILCVPLVVVLYLTQSHGAELALGASLLFVAALSVRNRKVLLIGGIVLALVGAFALVTFNAKIFDYFEGHVNQRNVSTTSKRFYLWQSALNMIHDSPWLGYGMDNWLCHYSKNDLCKNTLHHYWITNDGPAHSSSDWTGLSDEPTLSHPHNVFLHVWVSIGVFGMLAFAVTLILFFWLFACILRYLRAHRIRDGEQWRWMVVGVGAAMVAAMVQGLGDSAFLEQDLAFCFWTLVAALLLLRMLIGVPWLSTQEIRGESG